MKRMIFCVAAAAASLVLMPACNSTTDESINGRLKNEYGWKGSAEMPSGVKGYEAPTTRAKTEAESKSKAEAIPEIKTVEKKTASEIKKAPAADKIYVVKAKDTLSSIAKKEYKRADAWDIIYEANKDLLKGNPNRIRPGMKLRIPALKSGK